MHPNIKLPSSVELPAATHAPLHVCAGGPGPAARAGGATAPRSTRAAQHTPRCHAHASGGPPLRSKPLLGRIKKDSYLQGCSKDSYLQGCMQGAQGGHLPHLHVPVPPVLPVLGGRRVARGGGLRSLRGLEGALLVLRLRPRGWSWSRWSRWSRWKPGGKVARARGGGWEREGGGRA